MSGVTREVFSVCRACMHGKSFTNSVLWNYRKSPFPPEQLTAVGCPKMHIFTGFLLHKDVLLVVHSARLITSFQVWKSSCVARGEASVFDYGSWAVVAELGGGDSFARALSSPTMADSAPSKLFLRPHYAARLPRRTAPPLPPVFGRSGAAHSWLSALIRVIYMCVRWTERERAPLVPLRREKLLSFSEFRLHCEELRGFQRKRRMAVLLISGVLWSPASSHGISELVFALLCVWFVLDYIIYSLYMLNIYWRVVRVKTTSFCFK